jgi:hypothetical protein
MGKWLSRDPAEEEGGTNPYAFVDNDGINSIDFIGLWTTAAHEKIADFWLSDDYAKLKCACCGDLNIRQLVKNASAQADGFVGAENFHWAPNINPFSSHSFFRQQSAKHSNEHAMSYPGEPLEGPDSAPEQYDQFVNQKISDADNLLDNAPPGPERCKALQRAIADLGYAFHDITDHHSPKHEGYQQWGGVIYSLLHPRETYRHHVGETPQVWDDFTGKKML